MSSRILFECIDGVPTAVFSDGPDGIEREPDGVRFLSAEQAAAIQGKPVETMIDIHGVFVGESMNGCSPSVIAARNVVREKHAHLDDQQFGLFMQQCRRLQFSPLSNHIWSKVQYSSSTGQEELVIELSADGFFAIAQRTGELIEFVGPEWATSEEGPWHNIPPKGNIYAARAGVKRRGMDKPLFMVATMPAFAQVEADGSPNEFWSRMGYFMLGKCASCQALRRVFSEQFGGVYCPEEMMQASNPRPRPTQPSGSGGAPAMRLADDDISVNPKTTEQFMRAIIDMNFQNNAHRDATIEQFKTRWAAMYTQTRQVWFAKVLAELRRNPVEYGIETDAA